MFYFTCNESKIYESFTFWNKLQEKMNFFTILQFSEMHLYYLYVNQALYFPPKKKKKKKKEILVFLTWKNHPLHMSKYKVVVFREKLAIYNG